MIRLFRVFIPSSILGLLITETLLVVACYLAPLARQADDLALYLQVENGIWRLAVVTVSILTGLYLSDLYERVTMGPRIALLQQLCLIIGLAFLLQALLSYSRLDLPMPRQSMLWGSLLCLFLIPLWRSVYSKVALQVLGAEQVVFVGTHPLQLRIADHLASTPELALKPVGFYVENQAPPGSAGEHTVLGTIADLPRLAGKCRYDRIVVGLAEENTPEIIASILELHRSGYRTEGMAQAYEKLFGKVAISLLRPIDIIYTEQFAPSSFSLTLQSIYSWVIAFVGVLGLSPILILATLAVRLSSSGPVFYRQVRSGKNNQPFLLFKFRSMYVDAEARTGAVWAQKDDPRVTRVGRLLRQYRIDELPQLLNVLRGEMALVGPRPERPEFVKVLADQIPFYMQRLSVKPGITGWAQINYHYGNTFEDTVVKLEYDLYYIKNLALQLDVFIMFHTVKTMLLTRGAY